LATKSRRIASTRSDCVTSLHREHHAPLHWHARGARALIVVHREIVDERRLAHEIRDRPADVLARVELEQRRGVVVAPLDAVLVVEDHHAVGHRLRGAAKARERLAELLLAPLGTAFCLIERREHRVPAAAAFGHGVGLRILHPARELSELAQVIGQHARDAGRGNGPTRGRTDE
jgi:hypothetical protein